MKIEYDSRVPKGCMRFQCPECKSRWIAEEDGIDFFERRRPHYLGGLEYISYCPICGKEVRQSFSD